MKQILLLLLAFTAGQISAQETLEVQRCADIDRSVPIDNIFIDRDNNKWVADDQGLFLAQSPDFAKTVDIKADQWTPLSVAGGNKEIYFSKSNLEKLMGIGVGEITTAGVNGKKKEMWIGTANNGLFHFNTKSGLQLLKNFTSSNSKLRSNKIQSILITADGQVLAATDDGLFSKKDKKVELFSKGYDFKTITYHKGTIWAIADDEVLEMGKKGDLFEVDLDERIFDGVPVDIEFDRKGRLWVASDVVARYDFNSETYDFFGPAEDFTSQDVRCITVDRDGALWVGTKNKGVFYIGKSSSLSGSLLVTEYLNCKSGAKNAALQVRASGGEPPYTYKWNSGLKGEEPAGLGAGEYIVTITDQKGKKTTATVEIKESLLQISIKETKKAGMGGGKDGIAIVEVKGGNGQYTYLWDNGETTATATKLASGKHSVTISEKEGCNTSATVDIGEELAVLSVYLEQTTEIDCHGGKQGALKAVATGGEGPYKYTWAGTSVKGTIASNLAAGTYELTVTDKTSNTAVVALAIAEPSVLSATISPKSPATTNNADGKAIVKTKGGTGKSYTYKWTNGESTEQATKLAAGTHVVTVSDERGCSTTATIDITEDILPLSVKLNNEKPIKCAGDAIAMLVAEASGGKAPFTYQWSDSKAQGETASNVAAGDYSITITDAAATTAVTKITVKAPKVLSVKITPKSPATTNNADGKATAKGSGGTGKKYKYRWDTGETEATAAKLAAGKHSVTITDDNGCTTSANIEVSEDILPLSVNINNSKEIQCAGQNTAAIKAEVNGGKSPFKYEWSTASINGETASALAPGTYELTITDAASTTAVAKINVKAPAKLEAIIKVDAPASTNNSDGKASVKVKGGTGQYTYKWDNKETTAKANKLAPGKHQLTITDENACTVTATADVSENVLPLAVSIKQTAFIKCSGAKTAALEVDINGGKTPFDYKWNSDLKGGKASQLAAGNYELTLTDASGLSQTSSIKIEEPEKLTVAIAENKRATNENSKDGKVSLLVAGGTADFQYLWDNKETSAKAKKLPIGEHSVTVTDANGCSASLNVTTKKKLLPALTAGQLRQGQTLQVSNLYFEADSTNMTKESYPTLVEIAEFLKENPLVVIEVGGHTNNIPAAEFCDVLSTARAKAVATFIVQQGVDKNRVVYKGYGKREPKYSNNHADGRRKNQRVEMKILTLQ